MAFKVRAAQPGEEGDLVSAYEWLFSDPGRRPAGWDSDRAGRALSEAIARDDAAVMVAEEAGETIGLCTAYLDLNSVRFGSRCWVEDLAVGPESRGRGVGGALLDAAIEWARDRGAAHLELDTGLARTDAQRFYERREPDAVGYCYSWRL
jgi:GNAT superfamily N-acetyltransferase